MSSVIQALEDEVKAIGESIEKHARRGVDPKVIEELIKLEAKVGLVLTKLKDGIDLHMMCSSCKLVLPACEFGFTTTIQDCSDCGHHVKIEVTCPKCNVIRTVYRDRQYEGDDSNGT